MSTYCTECGRILTYMCGDDTNKEIDFDICSECDQINKEQESAVK